MENEGSVQTNTPGHCTLRYAVMSVLNELQEYNTRNYMRYLQFAVEAYTDINLYHMESIDVAYLTMSEANAIDLPPDYIDYTKVGIAIHGRIWTLTVNDNLLLNRRATCGQDISEIVSSDRLTTPDSFGIYGGYYFSDHFRNGSYVGGLYGVGGGFNVSYFRVDKRRNQIVFDGKVPRGEIILEYQSSGINANGSTFIPRQAIPAIKAYIHWKRIEYHNGYPMNEKMRKERLYDAEVEKLRHFESVPTMSDYLDSLYSTMKQSPKR